MAPWIGPTFFPKLQERFEKSFLRSFIKRIVVNKKQVTIYYNLPIPPEGKKKQSVGVLPIVTSGGAGGIRTLYLLTASLANVVTKDAFTFKMVDLCL